MGAAKRWAVGAAILLAVPLVGVASAPAELPITISGTATTATGPAVLTDVTITDRGASDQVVLTFAGDAMPEVVATADAPPFVGIPGTPVEVAGEAFLRLRMPGASGASFGSGCTPGGDPPVAGVDEVWVSLWFTCQGPLVGPAPVLLTSRLVPAGTDAEVLQATMAALLAGPTPNELDRGLSSPFSSATAGMVSSATIGPGGAAVVDLDPALATVVPTSSADAVRRELEVTATTPDIVSSVTFTLGGSCDAFAAWAGQPCGPITPSDAASGLFAQAYLGPERVTGPSVNVTEAVQLEDFESQLVWVIGLRHPADVVVSTASMPARVIVDVAHAPAVAATPTPATPTFTG